MTDKELLEMAAKAAGYIPIEYCSERWWWVDFSSARSGWWQPLTNDSDALRLAVKLEIEVASRNETSRADTIGKPPIYVDHEGDEYAATRRAIVRAAAQIGKTL